MAEPGLGPHESPTPMDLGVVEAAEPSQEEYVVVDDSEQRGTEPAALFQPSGESKKLPNLTREDLDAGLGQLHSAELSDISDTDVPWPGAATAGLSLSAPFDACVSSSVNPVLKPLPLFGGEPQLHRPSRTRIGYVEIVLPSTEELAAVLWNNRADIEVRRAIYHSLDTIPRAELGSPTDKPYESKEQKVAGQIMGTHYQEYCTDHHSVPHFCAQRIVQGHLRDKLSAHPRRALVLKYISYDIYWKATMNEKNYRGQVTTPMEMVYMMLLTINEEAEAFAEGHPFLSAADFRRLDNDLLTVAWRVGSARQEKWGRDPEVEPYTPIWPQWSKLARNIKYAYEPSRPLQRRPDGRYKVTRPNRRSKSKSASQQQPATAAASDSVIVPVSQPALVPATNPHTRGNSRRARNDASHSQPRPLIPKSRLPTSQPSAPSQAPSAPLFIRPVRLVPTAQPQQPFQQMHQPQQPFQQMHQPPLTFQQMHQPPQPCQQPPQSQQASQQQYPPPTAQRTFIQPQQPPQYPPQLPSHPLPQTSHLPPHQQAFQPPFQPPRPTAAPLQAIRLMPPFILNPRQPGPQYSSPSTAQPVHMYSQEGLHQPPPTSQPQPASSIFNDPFRHGPLSILVPPSPFPYPPPESPLNTPSFPPLTRPVYEQL